MGTPQIVAARPEIEHTINPLKAAWRRFGTPVLVVLMAIAIALTITRNWNAWEGGRIEQVTNDAYVRRDLTPLSTKVVGLVREVKVNDYQRVRQETSWCCWRTTISARRSRRPPPRSTRRRRRSKTTGVSARCRTRASSAPSPASIRRRRRSPRPQAGKGAVQADVSRTSAERQRQEALISTGSATRQHLEAAVADAERFTAQLASREADLTQARTLLRSNELAVEAERRSKAVIESQELQLVADLHAKEAALALAQVNLSYTRIVAPADGTVGERQVRPGQLVSPGTQVLSFVGGTAWVQANFRETQLTNISIGNPVEVRIDVYPGDVMRGRVIEIAPASGSQFALLPPDNATGNFTKVVQRVPVKIALDDSTLTPRLRSGLSAVVTVRTKS